MYNAYFNKIIKNMSKRKAEVNDIIFEIDSEDLESSSEDEKKPSKVAETSEAVVKKPDDENTDKEKIIEIVDVDSSSDEVVELDNSKRCMENGGKSNSPMNNDDFERESNDDLSKTDIDVENVSNTEESCIPDDIVVDSSSSSSSSSDSSSIAGCENKPPLLTVHFRDKRVAKNYKNKVKEFMLKMIKLHDEQNLTGSETDTDLELDIWPPNEDIKENNIDKDLFFIDNAPVNDDGEEVPQYSQVSCKFSVI